MARARHNQTLGQGTCKSSMTGDESGGNSSGTTLLVGVEVLQVQHV